MAARTCSRPADEAAFWRERAELLEAQNTRLAGENVRLEAENATLAATVAAQQEQLAALKQRVVTLSRMLFGTSSEKDGAGKRQAGGQAADADGGDDAPAGDGGAAGGRRRGQRPGSAGHGRRRHEHLETEEQVHDIPEGERRCPRCGRAYELFGEDASEQVSWRVRVWRVVHRRRKYARCCQCPVPAVRTAPGPATLIPRGLFTTEFCVNLLVAKYALGLPFNRVIAMLAMQGLEVAPGTLAGVARRLEELLAPLAAAIAARNAAAGHAHVDETSWRVFGQPADNGGSRWWLWVFTAADTVVYTIAASRSLKVPEDHYGVQAGQLPEGRRPLVISSDFYSVYRSFSELDGVTSLWCWAHIRRRFIRAGDAHRKELGSWADAWTGRFAALYAAHRALAAAPGGTGEHARAAAAFDAALEEIDAYRRIQGRRPDLLHPAAAKALATLDREWGGLVRHRDFPDLPLDNNTAERAIRTPVVGRKNYNGSGAEWSADLAGHAWTVLGTARITGHNPRAYLDAYLQACAANGGKPPAGQALEALLPWNITLTGQPGEPDGRKDQPP
jgi:transposase